MAARAYWKGQVRLALVSISVELYTATRTGASLAFNQIHEPTGQRIKYEKVVPGVGPVDRDDIIKGFEIEKGSYILLDDEEIEAVKLESKKTLELVQFVDAHEIDVLYYEKPYFMVPADKLAEDAFIVIREALRSTGKVGLGQLAVRGKEQLVSLKPCGQGMILEVLRYADEVRRAQGYFDEIPDTEPEAELLELAEALIEKKSAPFEPAHFHDRYQDALRQLIDEKAKAKGAKVVEEADEPAGAAGGNVIDLMAALKKSVDSARPAPKPPAKGRAKKKA